MHNHMLNTPRPMPRWSPPAGAEREVNSHLLSKFFHMMSYDMEYPFG